MPTVSFMEGALSTEHTGLIVLPLSIGHAVSASPVAASMKLDIEVSKIYHNFLDQTLMRCARRTWQT
jgi:hypothetical protein